MQLKYLARIDVARLGLGRKKQHRRMAQQSWHPDSSEDVPAFEGAVSTAHQQGGV